MDKNGEGVEVFSSLVECAKVLGVHVDTVRKAVRSGKLRAYKVGRNAFRIRQTDFEEYLKTVAYSSSVPTSK